MKTLRSAIALALVLLVPLVAQADEPTQQTVTVKTEVAAAPGTVWDTIGNFQNMSWHPAVFSSTGENGNAVGATRLLVLGAADGPTIAEVLDNYNAAGHSYGYRITEVDVAVLPVTDYSAQLTVRPTEGGSEIEWSGNFLRGDPSDQPAENLNDAAAVVAIAGVYELGMKSLRDTFFGQ